LLPDALRSARLLFIGHDANRGGAQIALLHLLRWLTSHHAVHGRLVLLRGGELEDEYRRVLPTCVLKPAVSPAAPVSLVAERTDLIYANTVVSLDLLTQLDAHHRFRAICHVHELEMGIRESCGLETWKRALPHVDTYIAASRAVADSLRDKHLVEPGRIQLVYEGIPVPVSDRPAARALGAGTRVALGIPADAFVVGGCGTMDWRKGADVFLQVARRLRASGAGPMHFIWVGGTTLGPALDRLLYDVERMGLGGRVHFVGPQREPMATFAAFDTFLLSSREDPFPLVCLEAAALAIPIVCFAGAGGMPELVEEDAGVVAPYLDIERAADAIVALATSESRRRAMGARAAEKVRVRHDIDVVGNQLAAVLERVLELA
jgi:glycosyltransferase involved in cell wall biosynthesis